MAPSWSPTGRWSTSASTSPLLAAPTRRRPPPSSPNWWGSTRRPTPSRSQAAGPEAFVTAITLREDGRTITDDQIGEIPGARAIRDSLPLAPTRTFARALLGTAAEANAEQIEKSGGALKAGDTTGTGGLQQQYDAQLRGSDGIQVFAEKAGLTAEERQASAQRRPPGPLPD